MLGTAAFGEALHSFHFLKFQHTLSHKLVWLILRIILLAGIATFRFASDWEPEDPILENIYVTLSGLAIFLLAQLIIFQIIFYIYRKRRDMRSDQQDNILNGLRNLGVIVASIAVILSIFGLFGIDPKTLFTSLSIVAAALAIISKEFINDLIVGLYMSFNRDFEINDYVRIDELRGKVMEIGLFKLKLLNDDDDWMLLSNSKVYGSEIVNYTRRDIRHMSIDFQVSLASIKNIDTLEVQLREALSSFSEYIEAESYNLKIVDLKKDYLDLKFQYTLKQIDRDMQRNIRRKTVREVLNKVSENN